MNCHLFTFRPIKIFFVEKKLYPHFILMLPAAYNVNKGQLKTSPIDKVL